MTPTALRPGTVVTTRSDPPPRGLASDSGTWFVVGTAQKGPTTRAQLIRSLQEFTAYFGTRQAYSILFDSMETFFREGGTRAYVVRAAGSSAAVATRTLLDASAGNSLTITAKNPGTWGNGVSVAVTAPTGSYFQIVVTVSGTVVDQSGLLVTQADAINWAYNSDWVNVAFPASSPSALPPAVAAAAALTGGVDDNAPTDTQRQAALAYFTSDLGGGQVSMPGNTTTANRTAMIAHCAAMGNREALLDNTDTASRSAAVTEASSLQASGNEWGTLLGPWHRIPGLTPNSARVVPPCAATAALIARSDSRQSVNIPAMGDNGVCRYVVDVTQPAWSDSDRDLLNSAGLNVFRAINGQVQLYGYRTLANPLLDPSWLGLGNQRLRQVITQQARGLAGGFVGSQLDQRTVSRFGGLLRDMLMAHYLDGALYGDAPEEAFVVDVGPSVNTPATMAANELHAVISLRMTPFAELVAIEIVKISIQQTL